MTYHFGLSRAYIAPWTSAETYGAPLAIESVRLYQVEPILETGELEGDDAFTDACAKAQAANVRLDFAFKNLQVIAILTGVTNTGDYLAHQEVFAPDSMPYFCLLGVSSPVSGTNSLSLFVPKVKLTSGLPFTFENGAYVVQNIAARAYYESEPYGVMKLIRGGEDMGIVLLGVPLLGDADTTSPTCTLSTTATDPMMSAVTVTVTFSEVVTGFSGAADLTVTHGTAGDPVDSGDHKVYSVTITPTSGDPADVTVQVAAGVCTDAAGNANTASNTLTFQRLYSYLATLGFTLDVRFQETSGNPANSGSDGTEGANAGATQGETGQLGTNEAYSFDGINDLVTFTNAALTGTKALTAFRGLAIIKANTLGEGNQGRLYQWETPSTSYFRFTPTNALRVGVDTDGTDALVITSNNQVSDILGVWALVAWDFDNTDSLGLGRKIRLFTATASKAPTLLTLGTNTAGTGTVTAATGNLSIGNRAAGDCTFDGWIDLLAMGAGVWSPALVPTNLSILNTISALAGFA